MRIPKYWDSVEVELKVDDVTQRSVVRGHSDVSQTDARSQALRNAEKVQARIISSEPRHWEEYEVCIREEILAELAPDAIVTRNRYGAEVLNCARLVIIDVDRAPEQGFWSLLFKRDRRPAKLRLLDHVRQTAKAHLSEGLGFRIYETHNGYRVMLVGKALPPAAPLVRDLFKAMRSDNLYVMLCLRQDCYRARLTPKPHRIKQKTIRLRFPYDAATATALTEWSRSYENASRRFSVCHLVDVIGDQRTDDVVRYHDDRCCRGNDLPLA